MNSKNSKIYETMPILMNGVKIQAEKEIKYLGVMLDCKLNNKVHLESRKDKFKLIKLKLLKLVMDYVRRAWLTRS